jgi:Na+-transporting NADH:ubiquinone oxidoreductase subunit E
MTDHSVLLAAFTVFFAAIFTNNILLTNYLGMCSFLSVSKEVKTSLGLGAAVVFVMTISNTLNWIVYYRVLVPLGIEYLSFIVFIVVVAAFVQVIEMTIERVSDQLYSALGIFLPLITVNCAILGACLFMIIRKYDFLTSVLYGLGSGLGWAMAIVVMAGLRWKMRASRVPAGLEGVGIVLVIAGIMALAFVGFTGVLRMN